MYNPDIPLFRQLNWHEVTSPLDDDQIRDWVEALRSDKYYQTTDMLCNGANGYCCLGVLAQVQDLFSALDIPEGEANLTQWNMDGGEDGINIVWKMPESLQDELARLNDSEQFSFKEIAIQLEKGFFDKPDDALLSLFPKLVKEINNKNTVD